MNQTIEINRAPVLTLWASVVAERVGYKPDEALTLAKGVTGRIAQVKGHRLGIYEEGGKEKKAENLGEHKESETYTINLMGLPISALQTQDGLRAVDDGKPTSPESVRKYLINKFGQALDGARKAMQELAGSYSEEELQQNGLRLYEKFRPEVPEGKKGWGAKGVLDLSLIIGLKK